MRKSILVKAPVLSRSGYGEQARFALRALRTREDLFDIYLMNIPWGKTGQIVGEEEERAWIEERLVQTALHAQQGGQFDMSLQITIPNEFEKIAPINIAYTAGIETTKVPPEWIDKTNATIDRMITVGMHGKKVFENTVYTVKNGETGEEVPEFRVKVPIEAVNYAVLQEDPEPVEIDFVTENNFLAVSQWGPRKNMENTIKWFVEEFKDDPTAGLVLKTNTAGDSTTDRLHTEARIEGLLKSVSEKRSCKVYLLHGEVTRGQLTWLYRHPTMKALVNIAHGEGFGLPMFEAAYNGLPLITVAWSGQMDFICRPNKKGKNFPRVLRVDYDIKPVQAEAVWKGVINEDAMWAFARETSYKRCLRAAIEKEAHCRQEAAGLQKHILEKFTEEKQYSQFIAAMGFTSMLEKVDYVFVNDMFKEQYVGGAELSLQALIDSCPGTHTKLNSAHLGSSALSFHKDATWIIGNVAQVNSPEVLQQVIDSGVKYHFIEFDYKFCEYRNPSLYQMLEDEECDYANTDQGKLITQFVNCSAQTHFMSQGQLDIYTKSLPDLDHQKAHVLSSVFDDTFFEQIQALRAAAPPKADNYIVLGSRSWVKGFADSEKWCKQNDISYDVINNLPPAEVLTRLAAAKGICFKPTGLDTCPRYVIEAKLLGCELELNEKVQHLDEEWFNTDDLDSIITYLKSRRNVFWTAVTGNE